MSLCEKTHTQLPLVGLAAESAENPPPSKSSELPAETESSDVRREYQRQYYREHKEKYKWPTDPLKRQKLNEAQMRRFHAKMTDPEFRANRAAYNRKRYAEAKSDPEEYRRIREMQKQNHATWQAKLPAEEKSVRWKVSRERKLAKDPEFDKRHDAKRKNDPQRKASKAANGRIYRAQNREKINRYKLAWQRKKMATDPHFRTVCYLRNRQNRAIKQAGQNKMGKSFDLLGCDQVTLISHIEKQFQPGMNWDNRGREAGTWQIDHIVAIFNFDLSTAEGQRAAFHYTNLQPLWYDDHLKKSALEDEARRRNRPQDAGKISDTPTVSEVVQATRPSEPQQATLQALGN